MCIAKGILRHVKVCSFFQLTFIKFIHVVGDTAVPSTVPQCV